MALSQADRIAVSKKIVTIPIEQATAEDLKAILEVERQKALGTDNANKNLQENQDALINGYQTELQRYDGNGRNVLVEQDLVDSAERKLQNPFFPNDPLTVLPNIPDGVWKFFPPFAGNAAIGKNYDESYTTVIKEQDLIDDINTQIAIVEALSDATRSTGKECTSSGTCSIPIHTNQTDCVNATGIWTPGPDIVVDSSDMIQASTDLQAAVQAWEDFINNTDSTIVTTDTNGTRAAENTAAKADIANTISVIDTWQALQEYDTTTSYPISCITFDTLPSSTFDPSKFRDTELDILKTEIIARESFNTGEILGGTGFYIQRFRFIDMRLNAIGGSLSELKGIESGQEAQQQSQNANDNAEIALAGVMTASAFRSPATNTKTVHLLNASGFSASDVAYVVAEKQAEIAVVVQSVDGNRVVLDKDIPEKYRHTDGARLYKVL
jgi:hypothetical protein